MKVLIIEDEKPAAEKLSLFLKQINPSIEILAITTSIDSSVDFLQQNKEKIELIFSDIQLSDGLCFEIFKQVDISIPIVFITAYNEYMLNAFKTTGIDYLLKPLSYEALEVSLSKIEKLKESFSSAVPTTAPIDFSQLATLLSSSQKKYRSRFMIKIRDHIKSFDTSEIVMFFAEGRDVFLVTNNNRSYIINQKLEELTNDLDPEKFMRVNRTYIVNIDFISEVISYSNSRLKIITNPAGDKEIIVSREKVTDFKKWFGGE